MPYQAVNAREVTRELLHFCNEPYLKVGRIRLLTLLLELDSQLHFSWKLFRRAPKSAAELLGVVSFYTPSRTFGIGMSVHLK